MAQANDFLAKYPPESVATVSKGDVCYTVINFDDYTFPDAYKAGELRELILSNTKESMTSEISRDVMGLDLAEYETKLENAQSELANVENSEVPMVIAKEGKMKGKEVLDYKVQEAKTKHATELTATIKELESSIANIKLGMEKLTESVGRMAKKNEALQKQLDKLNLN